MLFNGYRGCELYARNLVEGWMSVGDECLKFMREDYWTTMPQGTGQREEYHRDNLRAIIESIA